jgi:hypothetical protein
MRFEGGAFINCLNFLSRLEDWRLMKQRPVSAKTPQGTWKQLFVGLNSPSSQAVLRRRTSKGSQT